MVEFPIIKADVFNLDGKKIANKGQEITSDFLKTLTNQNPSPSKSLVQHPDLMEDLNNFLSLPPYHKIFDRERIRQETMQLLTRARIHPAVYESLLYFKENDFITYRHILTTSTLATRMANDMNSVYRHTLEVPSVTPSHDIGKINIPINILTKKEALTQDEIEILREHTLSGLILLTYYLGDGDPAACQVAYEHHELMDGTGYPRGFRQSNELVQIVTSCDIFDALITPRPYRKEDYSLRGALEVISDAASANKINVDCVKLLISYNRSPKTPWQDLEISKEHRVKEPQDNNYSMGHLGIQKETKEPLPSPEKI